VPAGRGGRAGFGVGAVLLGFFEGEPPFDDALRRRGIAVEPNDLVLHLAAHCLLLSCKGVEETLAAIGHVVHSCFEALIPKVVESDKARGRERKMFSRNHSGFLLLY